MTAARAGHVVVAPGHFKDALSSAEAARAIAAGVRLGWPGARALERPVADGGEGTLDALVLAGGGSRRGFPARDPLGRPVSAEIGLVPGGTVVVELARAAGIELLAEGERDPLATATWGVGDLIGAALDLGAKRIVVGLGGSATNDAGLGAAQALGVRFLDAGGRDLDPVGGALHRIERVDVSGRDPRLADVEIDLACDVDAPFHGARGAAEVFGPQKGADPDGVTQLEHGLAHVASVLRAETGVDVSALPGAGAAGGAGGGLVALLGARLVPGASLVLEAVELDQALEGAVLCLTGEGSLDEQTVGGKAPGRVAEAARRSGVPCVGLAGRLRLGPRRIREAGFACALAIGREPRSPRDALRATEEDLAAAGAAFGGLLESLVAARPREP